MDRTNFYTQTTVRGVKELDFLWNSLSSFSLKYEPQYYRVVSEDLMCPDLISYKMYGNEVFWWVICLVNEITNPFLDLQVGQVLTIPSKLDIYEFQRKNRVRRSQ